MGYMTRSRGGASAPALDVKPLLGFGSGGGGGRQPTPGRDAGKLVVDLTDPAASAAGALGSLGELGAGLAGGAFGLVGQVGLPGGPNLGDIPEAAGEALGLVGGIGLPGPVENVGAVPGAALDLVTAPGRFIEGEAAKARLRSAEQGIFGASPQAAQHTGGAAGVTDLPPDILARLDAGEDIDTLADELVARGAGFSGNEVANLVTGFVFDPLNFIAPGASRAARTARGASLAVDMAAIIPARLGLGTRIAGKLYQAASRGLPDIGKRATARLLGPTTSGVFHSLGTKRYIGLRSSLRALSPDYSRAFEDATALAAAQMPRAVVADQLADDVAAGLAEMVVKPQIADEIAGRLSAAREIAPDRIERRVENLLDRVKPTFAGMSDEAIAAETRTKLAAIAGLSPEDAARILPTVDRATAQLVHFAFYGKAGDDLAAAKAAALPAMRKFGKGRTAEDLTLVAPSNLTDERADLLAEALTKGSDPGTAALDAIGRYTILSKRYANRTYRTPDALVADLREFVGELRKSGGLTQAMRLPKSGKNALPAPLGAWRAKYADSGYEIGFAPADGWKAITTADGDTLVTDPFVHFVSERDPLGIRNPVGRLLDGLFRGIGQTKIIQTSRARMIDFGGRHGLTPAEAKAVHSAILHEARDLGTAPRGLSLFGGYERIFRDVLGDVRLGELRQSVDPGYLVMAAFEGDWRQVGLTQALTGRAKTIGAEVGNIPAAIAEGVYPNVKFRLSPVFQAQEFVESDVWNVMRGIEKADPEMVAVYRKLAELPEFRNLFEGYAMTYLAGVESARAFGRNTVLGKVLARFDVKGHKEGLRIAQVVSEHPEEFQAVVESINPRLWRLMGEAYGTTDARTITRTFLEERVAYATDPTKFATDFAKATPANLGADQRTVWEAFRWSLDSTNRQAFKTHFFPLERSFFERTVNHPYLALYPASYMWKVIGEFSRFLLKRPFGLRAPLVGLDAATRVQQAIVVARIEDPDFDQFLRDNDGAIYLLQTMIPGTPTDIPINAPAWARHIASDQLAGKPFDPARVSSDVSDIGQNLGIFRDVRNLSDAASDIFDSLQRAADEYDGMFSTPVPVR